MAANGRVLAGGRAPSKPAGSRSTRSPWLIQTDALGPARAAAAKQRVAAVPILRMRAPVLAVVGLLDDAAELVHQELEPVADAQDGHAEVEQIAVSRPGAPASSTLDGPPERMMPAGSQAATAVERERGGWISQ